MSIKLKSEAQAKDDAVSSLAIPALMLVAAGGRATDSLPFLGLDKVQRSRVKTITFSSRSWPVIKDVTEVSVAATALNFCPRNKHRVVSCGRH